MYCIKKNVNTNVMATFLSSIKNFTLDCTRYYDKVFTFSNLKFISKQQQTQFSSNNAQTIPAMGLGTSQEIDFYAKKLYQAASGFKTATTPATEGPGHTQCCSRDKLKNLKSKYRRRLRQSSPTALSTPLISS